MQYKNNIFNIYECGAVFPISLIVYSIYILTIGRKETSMVNMTEFIVVTNSSASTQVNITFYHEFQVSKLNC